MNDKRPKFPGGEINAPGERGGEGLEMLGVAKKTLIQIHFIPPPPKNSPLFFFLSPPPPSTREENLKGRIFVYMFPAETFGLGIVCDAYHTRDR